MICSQLRLGVSGARFLGERLRVRCTSVVDLLVRAIDSGEFRSAGGIVFGENAGLMGIRRLASVRVRTVGLQGPGRILAAHRRELQEAT